MGNRCNTILHHHIDATNLIDANKYRHKNRIKKRTHHTDGVQTDKEPTAHCGLSLCLHAMVIVRPNTVFGLRSSRRPTIYETVREYDAF